MILCSGCGVSERHGLAVLYTFLGPRDSVLVHNLAEEPAANRRPHGMNCPRTARPRTTSSKITSISVVLASSRAPWGYAATAWFQAECRPRSQVQIASKNGRTSAKRTVVGQEHTLQASMAGRFTGHRGSLAKTPEHELHVSRLARPSLRRIAKVNYSIFGNPDSDKFSFRILALSPCTPILQNC